MATKKAGGSSKNGRDSKGRRLGVKRYGDQLQANSCGKLINYKLLDLSQGKPKDKLDKSVAEVSINKSVFVTFDRMAASYAMMKKIPTPPLSRNTIVKPRSFEKFTVREL